MTSNNQILNDIKNNKGPNKYMVTLGYAGWDKSQLDKEVKNGDWLVVLQIIILFLKFQMIKNGIFLPF